MLKDNQQSLMNNQKNICESRPTSTKCFQLHLFLRK